MTDRNYTADACRIAGSFIDDLRDVDVSTMQEVLETDDDLDVDRLRAQITLVADDLDEVIDRQPDERPADPRQVDLEERLAVAEKVCALFGTTPSHLGTDREKALHELWRVWQDRYGHGVAWIDDAEVEKLAQQRDEKRAAALATLKKEVAK